MRGVSLQIPVEELRLGLLAYPDDGSVHLVTNFRKALIPGKRAAGGFLPPAARRQRAWALRSVATFDVFIVRLHLAHLESAGIFSDNMEVQLEHIPLCRVSTSLHRRYSRK